MTTAEAPAWLQITVTTPRAALAEAVFEEHGADAVTVLDAGVGLFTHGTPAEPILAALRDVLGDDVAAATETLENQDWAGAWLSQHPPLRFGERLWIAPHSAPVDADEDAVVVRLDPGLAFGTGTHATTALCLEWLARTDLTGRRVLDYGCGSGILAIAAARLGAASVTAVDIDDQAVRATRDNAARNGVADAVATPPMAPAASDVADTCSVSALVPTASTHHDRRPIIINAAYPTASSTPAALPASANRTPSARKSRRTSEGPNPTARSKPTSRLRCSTPSLKKSAARSSADATRKKLKYTKYAPKSVAPRDASKLSARTLRTAMPSANGSTRARRRCAYASRASSRDWPGAGATRRAVSAPCRDRQSRCPSTSGM